MSLLDVASSSKSRAILLLGILLLSASSVQMFAKGRSERNPEVVVVHPDELPPVARVPAQAMYLRAEGFSRYLYLEQENGARLAILDVSRPAHVKTIAEIQLKAPRYEFFSAMSSRFVLIRFTGSKAVLRMGALDLKNPQKPVLRDFDTSGMTSSSYSASMPEQGCRSDAETQNVRQEIITDDKLGSRFVLTANGLYIIRQPAVEKKFELEEFESYAG